jgi:hypothetical protein
MDWNRHAAEDRYPPKKAKQAHWIAQAKANTTSGAIRYMRYTLKEFPRTRRDEITPKNVVITTTEYRKKMADQMLHMTCISSSDGAATLCSYRVELLVSSHCRSGGRPRIKVPVSSDMIHTNDKRAARLMQIACRWNRSTQLSRIYRSFFGSMLFRTREQQWALIACSSQRVKSTGLIECLFHQSFSTVQSTPDKI